ncbi:hypothetical protein D1007_05886 [Hordeum vulgare]|nr:hypothetical protein D1007_05886 [Hordeum vulgare]
MELHSNAFKKGNDAMTPPLPASTQSQGWAFARSSTTPMNQRRSEALPNTQSHDPRPPAPPHGAAPLACPRASPSSTTRQTLSLPRTTRTHLCPAPDPPGRENPSLAKGDRDQVRPHRTAIATPHPSHGAPGLEPQPKSPSSSWSHPRPPAPPCAGGD